MILIVGSNRDDVLYYESIVKDAKEVDILSRYHVLIGKIGSQEIIVLQDIYTSYVSSSVLCYLFEKYVIDMVIVVGRCSLLKGSGQIGDVSLCRYSMFGDVDQIAAVKGTLLGQIPNYPPYFTAYLDANNSMKKCLEETFDGQVFESTYISSSFFRQNKEEVKNLSENEYVSSLSGNIVLDGETAGVALACNLFDIPFISIKVVEANGGEYTSLENYLLALKQYGNAGKAVVNFIVEMARTDVNHLE